MVENPYKTVEHRVSVAGQSPLYIRALADKQQFFDPDEKAAQRGISSAMWSLFGVLWPSCLKLAEEIAIRRPSPSARVLELGCGLALPSLVAHRQGADVTASDLHPLAAGFLHDNLKRNGLPEMKYRVAAWGQALPLEKTPEAERLAPASQFDLIVGSDLLYERGAAEPLAMLMAQHAAKGAEVWVVDPNRGHRTAFTQAMVRHGFESKERRLDAPADGHAEAYSGRLLSFFR